MYDVLGIPLGSGQPAEVRTIAAELRNWLNQKADEGYRFIFGMRGPFALWIIVIHSGHDPMEHGD